MLEGNIQQEQEYSYIKKEFLFKYTENLNVFGNLLEKSKLYVANQNHSNHIKLKYSSIQKILFQGQLESSNCIIFSFYKYFKVSNVKKGENQKETDSDESSIEVNKKNKNKNTFDCESILLNNKREIIISKLNNSESNEFYINCFNNFKVNAFCLKLFYVLIFCCGFFKFFYLYDILTETADKNLLCLNNLNKIFCFALIALLMATGYYGFQNIKMKIYNDIVCSNLTLICVISPLIGFAFSRMSSTDSWQKMINTVTSICSSVSSFLCVVILQEFEKNNYIEIK